MIFTYKIIVVMLNKIMLNKDTKSEVKLINLIILLLSRNLKFKLITVRVINYLISFYSGCSLIDNQQLSQQRYATKRCTKHFWFTLTPQLHGTVMKTFFRINFLNLVIIRKPIAEDLGFYKLATLKQIIIKLS